MLVSGGRAICAPLSLGCARDEVWTGAACQKSPRCGMGALFDAFYGRCVPFAAGGDTYAVNVEQWAYSTFGPPGGSGSPALCAFVARSALDFNVESGSSAVVRVTVTATFPNSEVARAMGDAATVFDRSGNAVPQPAANAVKAIVQDGVRALAQGGGLATALGATTTVRCTIVNGAKPTLVPGI
ncbi:MAG: hypothetical protein U0271_33820 [Polyangiaceae bacterium]